MGYFIDDNEDLMGRLLVGKATEGDQMLIHNQLDYADLYEDVYDQLTEMIEPLVQRSYVREDGEFPASVVDSVRILIEFWKASKTK